jgi:linoleoyl-CoA desaturase
MYLKTVIALTWLVTSYVYLVFFANTILEAVISGFALAQGFVLVGFNVMHDGAHGSYSSRKWLNWIMGYTLDLIGGSQMLWRQKHNVLHHTYTNLSEMDDDIDTGGILRLSPEQCWKPWHRFQHFYAFGIYSLLSLSWLYFSDYKKIITGRIGGYQLRKPSKADIFLFCFGKLLYIFYSIVVPLFFHPVSHVIIGFIGIHLILGFTLSIVFQLAHTVEGNAFPKPDPETGHIENEWAVHQIETTANFAPRNRLATWYLGGLNHQVEHHLFSKICHIHYSDLSRIVQATCKDYSIPYHSYPTIRSALFAHFRFLREMSTKPLSQQQNQHDLKKVYSE